MGAILPTSILQKIRLYNTTGIIEQHKNIYYVPRFSKSGATTPYSVHSLYFGMFEQVCPHNSTYGEVRISQWNPEDRQLTIEGNIDDFRLKSVKVDGYNPCLNYLIVTREVTYPNESTPRTFRYAYFISSAKQTGQKTVLLSLEPDDFTNCFYLNNTTSVAINTDYEPFNDIIKNAYVNRQHYDRMYFTYDRPGTHRYMVPSGFKAFINYPEKFSFRVQSIDFKAPIYMGGFDDILSTFSKDEMDIIDSTNSITNLPTYLRRKVIRASISFLYVVFKKNISCKVYVYNTTDEKTYDTQHMESPILDSNVYNSIQKVVIPFVDIPKQFKKYQGLISENIDQYIYLSLSGDSDALIADPTILNRSVTWDIKTIIKSLSRNGYGDYILSMYISKYSTLSHYIVFDMPNYKLKLETKLSDDTEDYDTHYISPRPVFLPINPADSSILHSEDRDPMVKGVYRTSEDDFNVVLQGFIGDGDRKKLFIGYTCYESAEDGQFTIDSDFKNEIEDYTEDYNEPILNQEPYTFYSFSLYGELEVILRKAKYENNYDMETNKYTLSFSLIQSISDVYKVGIIPIYDITGNKYRYYNEGLVYTVTASLPIISQDYYSYIYQNMSQMKNQYAVAEMNYIAGQKETGVSAIGSIFTGASVGALFGAGAGVVGAGKGLVGAITSSINNTIDYNKNKAIIESNQDAIKTDAGRKPDSIKQAGSDILYTIKTEELGFYLNHYVIDNLSYNTIAKMFERFGYQVDIYDSIHAVTRVGWDFVKLNSFDLEGAFTVAQEESIRRIFEEGVTLLHDNSYFTSGHNYEIILEGGN